MRGRAGRLYWQMMTKSAAVDRFVIRPICQKTIDYDMMILPKRPGWVTSVRVETSETVAFWSEAVLALLDTLISDSKHGVPLKGLANQLVLRGIIATSTLEGRMPREADICVSPSTWTPGRAISSAEKSVYPVVSITITIVCGSETAIS